MHGSSAVGVAQMIVSMIQTDGGKSEEDAKKVIMHTGYACHES